jgi:sugar lactone lactonase YvrE
MSGVIPIEACRIFHDGTVSEPRLLHPEGIAVDAAGNVWCGGELGQIYRLSPNGSTLEERASTGGFTLGMAFDAEGRLYTCDLKHRSVFRYDPAVDALSEFATLTAPRVTGPPNWPVVDVARNCIYVSESVGPETPGPGIWRFDLDTGDGGLWYDRPLAFANGMALAADGNALHVAETFGRRISRIPIDADGHPGDAETVAELPEALPDGLAIAADGTLYIACYEPSQILRLQPGGAPEVFVADPEAHTLCHPTNCAFRGSQLFIANLGRWHITVVDTDTEGLPLPVQPAT